MSNETLATSYGTVVSAVLAVGSVLATAIKRRCDPARAAHLLKFVAFPSSVLASSLNCYIVRSPEIASGVPLSDIAPRFSSPGGTSTSSRAVSQKDNFAERRKSASSSTASAARP